MIDAGKQAAIDQWTADPCGSSEVPEHEPGNKEYFEQLLAMRHNYAPWMAEAIGYASCSGLDVLDVGSGQGIDVAQYAMAGANTTGVDLTPRHVDLARKHVASLALEATIVNGDAEQLPFDADSFDRVSSNGVLHHTPDMAASLRSINRVLRPGGEARIIVYNKASLHYWVEQVLSLGILNRHLFEERSMAGVLSRGVEYSSTGARPLVRVYTPRRLRQMLRDAGFRNVRTEVYHFNMVDTFVTRKLQAKIPALRDRQRIDSIGRIAGWYVMGYGQR